MKYFYACLSDYNQTEKVMSDSNFSSSQAYIDFERDNEKWNSLLNVVQKDDVITIPSLRMFSFEEQDIKSKFEMIKECNLNLYNNDGKLIDVDLLLEFMVFAYESRKKKARELQRVGIEKALKKKEKGEGGFGRPRIEMPKDFEENLDRIFNKEMTHEAYRSLLGMKRSTYFKLVHEYKERSNLK